MSNESTFASVSGVINDIYEIALLTAREQTVMQPLVRVFGNTQSSTPRVWTQYSGGTVQTLAETADGSAQTFTHAAAGTLTPAQYFMMYFLTDQRIASDWANVRQDAGTDIGQNFSVAVDTNLVGLFSSLTGGTVGTAGGTLTWANIMRANAYLKAAYAPMPFSVVLRPEQWYYLTSVATGVPTLVQSNALKDSIAADYYVGSWGGMNFFIDGNITSGTAAVGGMFSRDAIALDVRRPLRIEPQRDASRGGGGYELNTTMIYAKGVFRPKFGAQLIGTSA